MIYSSLEYGDNKMWAKNIHSFSPYISSQSQPSGVQFIEHILKEISRRLFVELSYCLVQEDLICCHLTCPEATISSFRWTSVEGLHPSDRS
ncbi:hypothetical protein PVAP13_3NG181158 [Panicum virgatum]|uniref:Uncharacterized protein n=1 Tax=Panicum virgatum TaxID=38727 RepID=A0A8T0U8V2_PANVG|nr:hypothetical protein PVAP13_3NG181158 [Panicum virgatum]